MNATIEIRRLSEDIDETIMANIDMSINFMQGIEMLRSQYDFDFLCTAIQTYTDNEMSHIFLHEMNKMFILVPASQPIPHYLYIARIVPLSVFILTVFLLLMTTGLIITVKKLSKQNYKCTIILEDNLRLLMNTSIPLRRRRRAERIIFSLWLFFCLIFGLMFSSHLASVLIKLEYYHNIDTFEELYETDIKVSQKMLKNKSKIVVEY